MENAAQEPGVTGRPVRKRGRFRRLLAAGCLVVLLVACGGVTALGLALRAGPVQFGLPGNTSLSLGSENFVLSDYSFQNGTTYFADLNGSGVRNILEIHLLTNTRRLEVVVHHATHQQEGDDHLLDLTMP